MNITNLLNGTQMSQVAKISNDINKEYGDAGSCVLGYKLKVRDIYTIKQCWQGSISNDVFFKRVQEYLLTQVDQYNQPFTQNDFSVDYGRMD